MNVQESRCAISKCGDCGIEISISHCRNTDQRRRPPRQIARRDCERGNVGISRCANELNRDRQARQIASGDRDLSRQCRNSADDCRLHGCRIRVVIDDRACPRNAKAGVVKTQSERAACRVARHGDGLNFVVLKIGTVDRDLRNILPRKGPRELDGNRVRIKRSAPHNQVARSDRRQVTESRLNLSSGRVEVQCGCRLTIESQREIAACESCRQRQLLDLVRLGASGDDGSKPSRGGRDRQCRSVLAFSQPPSSDSKQHSPVRAEVGQRRSRPELIISSGSINVDRVQRCGVESLSRRELKQQLLGDLVSNITVLQKRPDVRAHRNKLGGRQQGTSLKQFSLLVHSPFGAGAQLLMAAIFSQPARPRKTVLYSANPRRQKHEVLLG